MSSYEIYKSAGLFSRNVPRYTSYPTALQFNDAVGPEQFGGWVAALPEGARVSVYVHIPFCERLCWFCACRTQGVRTLSPVAAYVEVLKDEISLLAAALPKGVKIGRLHWGGGSPTILSPEMIGDLAEHLRSLIPFADDIEFSVEIDPTNLSEEKMDAFAAAGMTRSSLGVQDFNPDVQAAIGREQSFEVTRYSVEGLRARGVKSVNIDLVYGLPFQGEAELSYTAQKVLSLSPERVAIFGYAHVPWMAKRQRMIPEDALPDAQARFELFNLASDIFTRAGMVSIGVDHFALPEDSMGIAAANGVLRRNFQGYTVDDSVALIGLGASSISRFPQGYAQNLSATNHYTTAITAGGWSAARGYALAGEDQLRADAIEMLMCFHHIDFAKLAAKHGADTEIIRRLCVGLAETYPKLTEMTDDAFVITPFGFPMTRIIASGLDAYQSSEKKHSMAI